MRVYFDLEFTGLHQFTTPISIGCISDDGQEFYAEFTDYEQVQVDAWIAANVLANLRGDLIPRVSMVDLVNWGALASEKCEIRGNRSDVESALRQWLHQWPAIEMWGDCLAYDWVLFCELFGGAMKVPRNVYYIPFDLCTLLKMKGHDPDVSREGMAGQWDASLSGLNDSRKHNALHDARVIRAIVHKLIGEGR